MPRAHTFDATAAELRVGDTLTISGRVHRITGITVPSRGGGGLLTLAGGIRLTLPPVTTVTVTRPIPDAIDTPRPAPHPPRFPL